MSAKNPKPKIAIFHCGFVYSGGGERIVLEEALGLKKRGYQVKVYAPTIDVKLCYPQLLKKLNVKMFLPSFIEWLPFRDALRMAATSLLAPFLAINFRDSDIFLGANQPGAWIAFCMAKVLKKPYLVYLNQPNRLIYPRKIDKQTGWQNRKDYYLLAKVIKLIHSFIRWADRVSINSCQSLLVNGDYIGQIITQIYGQDVVVCPGGVYPQKRLIKQNVFKGQFKIKNHLIVKPYILITNRHEPQKRFDYVLKALKKVLNKFPQVELVIPGPFTLYTLDLIALARKLKINHKVKFIGQITEVDLQKLYSQAVVYCYPSPEEDFGLGPLEAGAWGVPTVAWNHAGPGVTVKSNQTGYLAKPYEINDYADKILKLIDYPQQRAKMGLAAWNWTKNQFSWQRHINILEREIKQTIVSYLRRR
ncbi:glycosyltransferase family 4 protein [Patescibacteria group bacterium]|nr:glycosyltransferase family 4 protein [Patescibacteria group bacterium]MBU1931389.1 glycosyltransferase family 4 protein [Patescibacteria group bacterium]